MSESPPSSDNPLMNLEFIVNMLGGLGISMPNEISAVELGNTIPVIRLNQNTPNQGRPRSGNTNNADHDHTLGQQRASSDSNDSSEEEEGMVIEQAIPAQVQQIDQPAESLKSRVERVFINDQDSESEEEGRMSKWFKEYPFQEFDSVEDIKRVKKLLPKKNDPNRKLEEETIKLIIKIYETDQLMRNDSLNYLRQLFELIFHQERLLDWLTEQYQTHENSFGFCQKASKSQRNFMYQCFDCFEGGEDTKKFVCSDCFSKGNHRGHKTTRSFLGSICDCGSMNKVNSRAGNCTSHNGQFPIDAVLSKQRLLIIEERVKGFLILVFKIVEISNSFAAMKVLGEVLANLFIRPLNKLLFTFPSMIPHISMMFVTPLGQIDGAWTKPALEMQHNHKDLNSGFPSLCKNQKCDCSAFELIFRYSLKFTLRDQKRFNQLAHRLISYRPFMSELGGQWLKLYNKVARTKGESEEKKPPLANIKHDIVVDAQIMIASVKKYGLTHFIDQIFKNIEEVIDDPDTCFMPGLNIKLPSSINVLPSITKYPENCLVAMKDPQFIKVLYPAFFKIYEKVLGQGLKLRKQNKFMESEDLQVFLLRYQYDIYHSINQLIFGLKNNSLEECTEPYLLNTRIVAALMLSMYHKRLAEPVALKSFEGFAPRCFLTYIVGWLCLDCTNKDNPRVDDMKEQVLNQLNSSIFFNNYSTQRYFYIRLCRSFADIIGSIFFIRRLKWDIWDHGWQKILQVYEKIEFDGIDICGLQFTFTQVKFENAVAELFRGFFLLEAYQCEKKTKPVDLDLTSSDLTNSLKQVMEEVEMESINSSEEQASKKQNRCRSKKDKVKIAESSPPWQKLMKEHEVSYKHFSSNDHGLAAHTTKIHLLLADFFNLLTTVCSSEHSIFGVISEMVLVRNSAFRRALLKQDDKFYFPAAKMQFLHLMLALKTVPCDEFFDLMKAYVCCEEGFQDSVVAEYCDVDFENQVIKLKPRAEEIAMKNFDSSCFSLKRASEDFDNRWEQNISKELYNKLSFKRTYTCELIRLVRQNLSKCDPQFIVDMIIHNCKQVSAEILNQKPFSLQVSIFRFVLLYLHTLHDPRFEIAQDKIIERTEIIACQIIAMFENKAKDSPILKLFKVQLSEYRSTGMLEHSLTKSLSMVISGGGQELNDEKKSPKITQIFTNKKEAIFRRMKQRQNKFFSMLDDLTASFIKDFNTLASADTMVCSVTKEQLSDRETFFIFANMSESNLLHHSKINTLKTMASEKNLSQEDLHVILELIDEEKKMPKERLDDVLISQCGHYLKSESHAMIGDPKNGYRDNEYICPLCKSSSNCLLPIYPVEVWESLCNKNLFHNPVARSTRQQSQLPELDSFAAFDIMDRVECYFELYSALKRLMSNHIQRQTPKQKEFVNLIETQREIAKSFVERIKTNLLVNIENLIKNGGYSIGCISSMEEPFFNICPASFALASTLRYSELKGFAASIGAYGQVMHSLYMTARIQRVHQGSFSLAVMNYLQQQLGWLQNATDFKPHITALLCLPALLGESEHDVELLLGYFTSLCLDLQLYHLLAPEIHSNPSTGLTWDSIRYSTAYAPVISCILRFLRIAGLLQYSRRYRDYQKNKKLLEKVIQLHLKGDEKELEYLFVFLDLPVPDINQLTVRVQTGLRKFGVVWENPVANIEPERDLHEKSVSPLILADTVSNLAKKRRIVNGSPVSLSLIPIGKTMKDALEIFYHTPCKQCGAKAHMASMCLICGEVICGLVCGFTGNIMELKKNGVKGQLCKHSITEHKGKTAYLNCESLFVLLFDDSRKIVFKGMYFNKFGKIGEKDSDFEFQRDSENYLLNSKRLNEIYQLIANNEGLQYIMRKSFSEDLDPIAFFY